MDAIHEADHELLKKKISAQMDSLGISKSDVAYVISEIDALDPWTKNIREGPLRSAHTRQKYFAEHFSYVKPIEVKLGQNANKRERSFHYIPVLETLKSFVQTNSAFMTYLQNSADKTGSAFHDVHDGSVFKSNKLFEGKALQIILYQDAFEVVNPLGSGRGKHKLIGTYFVLANIEPHNRSKIDQIQLVLLCSEKDMKDFGEEKIYQMLIDDLKKLETEGILCKMKDFLKAQSLPL